MLHLKHPSTGELLAGIFEAGPNARTPVGWATTTDPIKAMNFYPDDVDRIRKRTGVEWVSVPLPATRESGVPQ